MPKTRNAAPKLKKSRGKAKEEKQEKLFKYFQWGGAKEPILSGKTSTKRKRKAKDGKENREGKSITDYFKVPGKINPPKPSEQGEDLQAALKERAPKLKEIELKPQQQPQTQAKVVSALKPDAPVSKPISTNILLDEMLDVVEIPESKGEEEKASERGAGKRKPAREEKKSGLLGKRSNIEPALNDEPIMVKRQTLGRKKMKKCSEIENKRSNLVKTQKKRKRRVKEIIIDDVVLEKENKKTQIKKNEVKQTILEPKRNLRKSKLKKIPKVPRTPKKKSVARKPKVDKIIEVKKAKPSKYKNKRAVKQKILKTVTNSEIKETKERVVVETCTLPVIRHSKIGDNTREQDSQEVIIVKPKLPKATPKTTSKPTPKPTLKLVQELKPIQAPNPAKSTSFCKTAKKQKRGKKGKLTKLKKKEIKTKAVPTPTQEVDKELLKLVFRTIEKMYDANKSDAITPKALLVSLTATEWIPNDTLLTRILEILSDKNKIFITSDNGNIYKL